MPNQPNRLTATTRPISTEPMRPKPHQRASRLPEIPSLIPAKPSPNVTTPKIRLPIEIAIKASVRVIELPSTAPNINWSKAVSIPICTMATPRKETLLSCGTRLSG
ncbi:hypothetical protein D3C71_1645560 [compost metagenome]